MREPLSPREQLFRYGVVGGLNTGLSYSLFAALYSLFGEELHYVFILVVVTLVTGLFGFVCYRRFVFRVSGHVVRDLLRFSSVYAITLSVNVMLLPLLVEAGGLPVLLGQAFAMIGTAAAGFVANRHFAFSRA